MALKHLENAHPASRISLALFPDRVLNQKTRIDDPKKAKL